MSENVREQIDCNGEMVPIYRQNIAEIYIALEPPEATPYVVAPKAAEGAEIAQFFAARVARIEQLREKMRKRFEKSPSEKCSYQTGDVAYVMGRPFMLEVNPLGRARGVRGGARGRANVSYNIDIEVSLISLYVMKTGDYDQCRNAFLIYGRAIVCKNAATFAKRFLDEFGVATDTLAVRMRAMRNDFAKVESGALWVSEDVVAYPVTCLAYAVGTAVGAYAGASEEDIAAALERVLPGYEHARELLASRAKPYSNQ